MNHPFWVFVLASMTLGAAPSLVAQAKEPPTFQQIVQSYVDQGRFVGANGVVITVVKGHPVAKNEG